MATLTCFSNLAGEIFSAKCRWFPFLPVIIQQPAVVSVKNTENSYWVDRISAPSDL